MNDLYSYFTCHTHSLTHTHTCQRTLSFLYPSLYTILNPMFVHFRLLRWIHNLILISSLSFFRRLHINSIRMFFSYFTIIFCGQCVICLLFFMCPWSLSFFFSFSFSVSSYSSYYCFIFLLFSLIWFLFHHYLYLCVYIYMITLTTPNTEIAAANLSTFWLLELTIFSFFCFECFSKQIDTNI